MLTFADVRQETPDGRDIETRLQDFGQTYVLFDEAQAARQAERCIGCATHPCSAGLSVKMIGCPLENNIQDWLRLVAKGDLKSAFQSSLETNPMNSVINAVLCPVQKLCAGACISQTSGHGAISMGYVEQHLATIGWQSGWAPKIAPRAERDQSVAIIGSGPAGYGAAIEMRKLGYRVTMFERNEVPGGLLTLGIPNFKIGKEHVLPLYDYLADNGVEIRCNSDVGGNVSYQGVLDNFDAVVNATGAQLTRNPELANGSGRLLVPALDALTARNRIDLQLLKEKGFKSRFLENFQNPGDVRGLLNVEGQHVAVLGGGDTSIDLVRTWRRYNPDSVTLMYRGEQKTLRASPKEIKAATDEQVQFLFQAEAREIHHDRAQISVASRSADFTATRVGSAIGFTGEDLNKKFEVEGLPLNKANALTVRSVASTKKFNGVGSGLTAVYQKSNGGNTIVMSAGDAVRGPSLAVLALRDGMDVARSIHKLLSTPRLVSEDFSDVPKLRFG